MVSSFAQGKLEKLGRGIVAVRNNPNQVFISWRMLKTDPTNIGFNLYRGSIKVNATPIMATTNYTDNTSANDIYTVKPVMGGVEQASSSSAAVWATNILRVPLRKPAGGVTPAWGTWPNGEPYEYTANDCSAADLDGDGEYEILVKWEGLGRDNSQQGYTANVLIDAYKINGTFLWRIDLGRNIRAGAHYTQFIAYDLDGDGKAELGVKTAPNTKDGTGKYLSMGPAATDDDSADYRTQPGWAGFIISGPEYLTIFNGQTGAEMATVNYTPDRNPTNSWGKWDDHTNRLDRMLAGVGFFDGNKPSLLMCRGYYGRSALVAWDWQNGQLTQRWKFDTYENGLSNYEGQGNHNLSIADVDADGKDEVIYGSMVIDDNGSGLWSNGLGHGDALHAGDFLPQRPGLEIWKCHEGAGVNGNIGLSLTDAKTGQLIWHVPGYGDMGRCMTGDIDARYPGNEFWGIGGSGVYSSTGQLIASGSPTMNFGIWWDGDLLREVLDDSKLDKWGVGRIFTVYQTGASSNNGTKATPGLTADILGDWREEMVYRNPTSEELLILTTTIPTPHKLYTLMHDVQYREAIAWQNVGYNQPPHPSFFLGAGMNAQLTLADNPADILHVTASEGALFDTTIQSLTNRFVTNTQLTFVKGMGPDWLTVAADGTLSGTPGDINKGMNLFTIQVLSQGIVIDIIFLQVDVADTNSPPVWSSQNIHTAKAILGYEYDASVAKEATDADSRITFTKESGPDWLSVSADGKLGGRPLPAHIGENTFVLKAIDQDGASALTTLTVQVIKLGLTNHYKFEENAEDSEGQQHGIITGTPAYQTGVVNKSILLDGNDEISLPPGIVNYQKLTIATWIKWNGGPDWQRIFDIGNDRNAYMFLTPKTGTNLRFAIKTAATVEQIINGPSLPIGVWKHVAVTLDGSTAKLYVDGVMVGQNTTMVLNPASLGKTVQNFIGKSQFPDALLRAEIDAFRIYNYSLSDGEILDLKNLQPSGIPVLKSAKEAIAILHVPFDYVAVATNKPTAYRATNLPTGLSIDSISGLITGTPAAVAEFPVYLQMTNAAGTSNDTVKLIIKSNVVSINKVIAGEERNVIEWTPLLNLTYNVKRSLSPDGPFTTIGTVSLPNYTDNAITPGVIYYYMITSVYNNQELANSAVIVATPASKQFSYWKFDEASGTVGLDNWGTRNATLQAGVLRADGKLGNGIKLDGSGASYATLPTGVVSTLNDFTIATWIKMDTKANWMRVFDFGSGTGNFMFLSVQAGAANVMRYSIKNNNSGEQQVSANYTLPIGEWTHFAITQEGNTAKMYINGALMATNPGITFKPSNLGNTTQNYLGKAQYSDPLFKGTIDEFKIFNRALSPLEIANAMKQFQTITFDTLGEKAIGDSDFYVGAIASSGLPITYTSSNDSIASVRDGKVQINGIGTTTIVAFQEGNDQYAPALSKAQKLVVTKKNQTISFAANATKMMGDIDADLTAVASSGLPISYTISDTSVAIIINGKLHLKQVGTVIITANQSGDALYKAAPAVQQTLSVVPVPLQVLYKNGDGNNTTNNTIKPYLKIVNTGTINFLYKELKVRYWFTPENFSQAINSWIDYAQVGSSMVKMKYVSLRQPYSGAFGYIEYSFEQNAGTLTPGSHSGVIQSRFANADWSSFNEVDDYSFGTQVDYATNAHITLYRNDVLVGGVEPTAVPAVTDLKIYAECKTDGSNTIKTYLKIANEGNVAIPYGELSVRYWFTAEGTAALNYWTDYAKLGNSNVTGTFTRLTTAVQGADTYLEIKINPVVGTLYSLAGSGDIQFRVAKADWSNFQQNDDYSYQSGINFPQNAKITLYRNGQLIWGQEPAMVQYANEKSIAFEAAHLSVDSLLGKNLPAAVAQETTGIIMYPNPVTTELNIQLPKGSAGIIMQLYNSTGTSVMTKRLLHTSNTIPLQGLPAGVYYVQAVDQGKTITKKIMKQ